MSEVGASSWQDREGRETTVAAAKSVGREVDKRVRTQKKPKPGTYGTVPSSRQKRGKEVGLSQRKSATEP